jgi:general stress protein YciG
VTDETTARQRTGGLTTLARHGREHFAAAGRKGGTTLRDTYGSEHLSTMGKTGGEQTRNRHGHEHFVEAGRKGGLANRGRVNTKPSPLRGRAKVPRVPDAMLSDLRARIQLSGLTQMELAARLGITQPHALTSAPGTAAYLRGVGRLGMAGTYSNLTSNCC